MKSVGLPFNIIVIILISLIAFTLYTSFFYRNISVLFTNIFQLTNNTAGNLRNVSINPKCLTITQAEIDNVIKEYFAQKGLSCDGCFKTKCNRGENNIECSVTCCRFLDCSSCGYVYKVVLDCDLNIISGP